MPTDPINSLDDSLAFRLGSDIRFPLSGNFATIAGIQVLLQDIQTLLLTIPGERVNEPEFGCGLRELIWDNTTTVATLGAGAIKTALSLFEPRISVTAVESEINENTGLITFIIRFSIINTDIDTNLIFPFRTTEQIVG